MRQENSFLSGSTGDQAERQRPEWGRYGAMLGFLAMCAVSYVLSRPDPLAYNAANVPGCVSQRQSKIKDDVLASQLQYRSTARYETDDKDLHLKFLSRVFDIGVVNEKYPSGSGFYVTFMVYYHPLFQFYDQFATSVICKGEFDLKDTPCRNRNYYFFRHLDPVTLANVIVEDIAKHTPVVRRCAWDRTP